MHAPLHCPICKTGTVSDVFPATDVVSGKQFDYRKCNNCEVVYIDTVPADLGEYYFNNYYSFSGSKLSLLNRVKHYRDRYEITGRGMAGRFFSFLTPNYTLRALKELSLHRESRLLDSGCGTGRDIAVLRELGYTNVMGADPFIDSDVHHRGSLLVEKKNLSEVNGMFNVVTLHHSFEHVPNPGETMQHAYRLLDNSGLLVIRIPVSDSWAYEHYGQDWVQFDAPRHLYLHTRRSMEILGNETGFDLVKVIYDSCDFQMWGSEATRKKQSVHILKKQQLLYWKMMSKLKGYSKKAKHLNAAMKGDQAMFVFRKKNSKVEF